jgi:hypothetical protein
MCQLVESRHAKRHRDLISHRIARLDFVVDITLLHDADSDVLL